MKRILAATAALLTAGTAVLAADEKTVTYFEETCGACHGAKGEGTPGLAPPLKGSKFVKESSAADVAAVITNGRAGAQKHFPNLASPMPAHSLSEKKLGAVVSYVKGELQQ
jgi:mono/diheme cytochrome c family protein